MGKKKKPNQQSDLKLENHSSLLLYHYGLSKRKRHPPIFIPFDKLFLTNSIDKPQAQKFHLISFLKKFLLKKSLQ